MKRTGVTATLLGLLLLTGIQGCSNRADSGPAWLVGEWHVSFNPLHDDADVLKFMPESKAAILTEDGRRMTGHYLIHENTLVLVIDKGGHSIETQFQISTARDRLTYKNGAFYTRAGSPDAAASAQDADK